MIELTTLAPAPVVNENLVEKQTDLIDRELKEQLEKIKQRKLELVRISKEILVENSRYKSVDEKDVSAEDVINMANKLNNFIES